MRHISTRCITWFLGRPVPEYSTNPHICRLRPLIDRHCRCGSSRADNGITTLIKNNTELTNDHMTPEIKLHLITRRCPLWTKREDTPTFSDPFWAFYWPGGQVLTRFILDNPDVFKDESVLDVGSGCGASSIACSMVGAGCCVANDVDTDAIGAIKLNAAANNVSMTTDCSNLIGQLNPYWSVILLGDMFYDDDFRDSLVTWLTEHYRKFKTNIYIGDPGRLSLNNHPIRNQLTKVAEYELSKECQEENYGLTRRYVWKLQNCSRNAVTRQLANRKVWTNNLI